MNNSPWGDKELDMTERLTLAKMQLYSSNRTMVEGTLVWAIGRFGF